jgi:hypothetical protein
MRIRAVIIAAALAALASIALSPTAASAHVQQTVGPISMEVGFGTEPAYAGQPNSVYLLLEKNGKPVVDLGDTLKVTVGYGSQSADFPIVPNFEVGGDGVPGEYRAWFVPSQPGPYTFHFTGTVDGTKIDQSFTSGPKTFNAVEDLAAATFPKVEFPTNGQIAQRISQDSARTSAALTTATGATASARRAANTARLIAVIGFVVGVAGLIVAVRALQASRKRG